MNEMDSITLITAFYSVIKALIKPLKRFVVEKLLFDSSTNKDYLNKEAFKEITERYKDSINDVNQKIVFTVTFAFIALYVYFVLPETETVKIPVIDISVSRQIWISVAPAISYGLAILIVTSFLWFVALRIGIKTLVNESENHPLLKEQDSREVFVDLTDLHLKGGLGTIWMIFRIREIFKSKWNYVWYVPLLLLIILVVLSPAIIPLFFTYLLFQIQYIGLGIIYAIIFIPISFLLVLLIGTVGLLGLSENI